MRIDPGRLVPCPRIIEARNEFFPLSIKERKLFSDYVVGGKLPSNVSVSYTADQSRPDWYRIVASHAHIEITCTDAVSLLYAVRTCSQVFSQFQNGRVLEFTIEDWADFPVRAFMLDVSRTRVPNMETLFEIIDLCSSLKINQLQLYMEHTFAYQGHEQVWRGASPFTKSEIRQVSEYCRQHGILLVPNQNSFGHMERWLCHDAYKHLAEAPDGFNDPWGVFRPISSTLAPQEEAVWPFLEDLYDQLLPCFEGDLFHVGGDEPWELCQGRSRQICRERGLSDVYVGFLNHLHELVVSKGRVMMVWADILLKYPEAAKHLSRDIILVDWGYEADHPFESELEALKKLGFTYLACVGTSSWNSIGGRLGNARENIISGASHAFERGASGLVVADWGDNGHMQQLPISFPGLVLGAVAGWNTEMSRSLDLEQALFTVLPSYERLIEPLLLLGQVGELYGEHLHNMSLPAAIMLDHMIPYYRSEVASAAGYSFTRELRLLDRIDRLIRGYGKAADELRWTSGILRFACAYGNELLSTGNCSISEIPRENRIQLSKRLEILIWEYRRLWIERSRPGGLDESSHILVSLNEQLISG
jgi:hypothetical protein